MIVKVSTHITGLVVHLITTPRKDPAETTLPRRASKMHCECNAESARKTRYQSTEHQDPTPTASKSNAAFASNKLCHATAIPFAQNCSAHWSSSIKGNAKMHARFNSDTKECDTVFRERTRTQYESLPFGNDHMMHQRAGRNEKWPRKRGEQRQLHERRVSGCGPGV